MKFNFGDLSIHFWIGLGIFIAHGIAGGTIHLTNMIPDAAIPAVTAWSSALTTIGLGYLVAALGLQTKIS